MYSLYNKVFAHVAGHENVGWFAKDAAGQIVKVDASGRFARMAGLTETEILGATTANLPWSNTAQAVEVTDALARDGEVKESVGIYWHPVDKQWRRLVCAKWLVDGSSLNIEGDGLIYCMLMDITGINYGPYSTPVLLNLIEFDWEKEAIIIGGSTISRAHTICLSYYLDHISQSQIAIETAVTLKTVEKRIAHLKHVLLPLDTSCDNLYIFCRKYGIRAALEEKRDWFDRQAVIRPVIHGQWAASTANE